MEIESQPLKRMKLQAAYEEGIRKQRELEELINEAETFETTVQSEYTQEVLLGDLEQLRDAIEELKRVKFEFSKTPEQWIKAEAAIHKLVRQLGGVAAYPRLMRVFIDNAGISLLAEVLTSHNLDLCSDAVRFILEMSEIEVDEDDDDLLQIGLLLAEQTLASSIPHALSSLLSRLNLDKDEQRETSFEVLGIFENLFELLPSAASVVGTKTGLLEWIIGLLLPTGGPRQLLLTHTDNALYASELLSILLQESEVQKYLATIHKEGAFLSFFRELQELPQCPADFKETILNLFNSQALALLHRPNQEAFQQGEGIDIMLRLLKYYTITPGQRPSTLDMPSASSTSPP